MQNPISIYTKIRSSSAELYFYIHKVPYIYAEY